MKFNKKLFIFFTMASLVYHINASEISRGISAAAFSNDGTRFAGATVDGCFTLWDSNTGLKIKEIKTSCFAANTLCFDHSDTFIVAGSEYSGIIIWDLSTNTWTNLSTQSVSDLSISNDNNTVYAGCFAPYCIELSMSSGEQRRYFVNIEQKGIGITPCMLETSVDGRYLITADYRISLWDLHSHDRTDVLSTSSSFCNDIDTDNEFSLLAAGFDDGHIELYSLQTRSLEKRERIHNSPISCLSYSSEYKQIASNAKGDSSITIWYLNDDKKAFIHAHDKEITSLSYSPSSNYLLSSSLDGKIIIWDMKTLQVYLSVSP